MSHKFTDSVGRVWDVDLNGYTIQKVKQDCDVFLTDFADVSGGQQCLVARMFSPPYVLLVQVLWSLCEEQAIERGVLSKDFMKGLGGNTLDGGKEALTATVADFFTSQEERDAFMAIITKATEMEQILIRRAKTAIDAIDPISLAKTTTASFSKPAEYAELIPTGGS